MGLSFFQPAPQEPSPSSTPGPSLRTGKKAPWAGPLQSDPSNIIQLDMLVASSDVAEVVLNKIGVYADGYLFDVGAVARPPFAHSDEESRRKWRIDRMDSLRKNEPGSLPEGLLRLGVQLPDGRKATTLDYVIAPIDQPPGVVFMEIAGAGYLIKDNVISVRHSLWLWPIPPPGGLDIVTEWPAFGIPTTRTNIDGDRFIGSVW